MNKEIEIPFGAKDSELKGWEYTIPENMEAEIKDGKIIVREKESDDERIRKDLITFVCQFAPEHLKVQYIAYLEKQKEQRSEINIEHLKSYMLQYLQDAASKKEDSEIEADTDKWAKMIIKAFEGIEQKPMHFLEIPAGDIAPAEEDDPFDEDEFLDGELSAFLQNYDKEYDDDTAVSDVARHFYEIGKKQKEQKPASGNSEKPNNHAEWSEDIIRKAIEEVGLTQHQINWFKNNVFPPKQEWSETDKLHLNNAILVAKKEWGVNSYTARFLESLRDNCKKCNCHWKPSEEQMEALKDAFRKDGGNEYRKVINSLYCDLQKLL